MDRLPWNEIKQYAESWYCETTTLHDERYLEFSEVEYNWRNFAVIPLQSSQVHIIPRQIAVLNYQMEGDKKRFKLGLKCLPLLNCETWPPKKDFPAFYENDPDQYDDSITEND